MGILEYMGLTSGYGIAFQRGARDGIQLESFADANFIRDLYDRQEVCFRQTCDVCWCQYMLVSRR